jgi:hypothetical protein
MLSGVRGAVQAELDAFLALLDQRTRLCRVVNASAFSKARSRLVGNVKLLRLADERLDQIHPEW